MGKHFFMWRGTSVPLRKALMAAGGRMSTVHLINLRTVLSYLEIGKDLATTPGGEHPTSLKDSTGLFEIALNRIRGDKPLYLEFGVFEGRSLRWWSEHLTTSGARLVGFDSFEGLPENWWPGLDKGNFATGGPPAIEDSRVSFQVGWFDETLRHFTPPEHDQLIINIDSDLYSSAATVLKWATPFLVPGTLIYFDEYPDRDNEMRALTEYRRTSAVEFVPLAFAGGGIHWLFEVRARS